MSHKVEPPEGGDGRPGGDSDGFDHTLVVPDDARELDRDLEAWKREERWRQRKQFLERIVFTAGRRERGISGLFIVTVLIAVAMLGATISILAMRGSKAAPPPVALELASPLAPPGTPGGLLPNEVLAAGTTPVPARDLRPALIAIVTPDCGCSQAVAALTSEATVNALRVYLVGSSAQTQQLDQLVSQTRPARVRALIDDKGALIATYAPHGLTVIPVHADGVAEAVIRDYTAETSLGPELAGLKHPGPVS